MFDDICSVIKTSTEEMESQYQLLIAIIDEILENLIAEDACFRQLMTEMDPSADHKSPYAQTIADLSQMQRCLSEISEQCCQTCAHFNEANSFTGGRPYTGGSEALYVTIDPLIEAEYYIRNVSEALSEQLHTAERTSHSIASPHSDALAFDSLLRNVDQYLRHAQKMQDLYEQISEQLHVRAEAFHAAEESILHSLSDFSAFSSSNSRPRSKGANHHTESAVSEADTADSAQKEDNAPSIELNKVQFSAVAPKAFVKGEYSLIEILMYEDAFRHVIDEVIEESDVPVKEIRGSTLSIEKRARIKAVLRSPDLEIEDSEQELDWQGEFARFSFVVDLPIEYRKSQIPFTAVIYINDVIATRLKFIVKCQSPEFQRMEVIREDVLSAFISYASQDRSAVAMIVHGMKKVRPDMDIFFDVDSLRSGEHWEKRLWAEIDRRDVLYLCWSRFARNSEWVNAEWRYALKSKGMDGIEPVPIESPENCPPPEELAQKHFNDMLLYIANANRSS